MARRDRYFDGYSHPSLPDVTLDFSLKDEESATQPEAVVDVKHGGDWIRLPITEVQTTLDKDGPADLTATSEVRCPVVWGRDPFDGGGVPIYEFVGEDREELPEGATGLQQGAFDDSDGFDLGRVYYWNQYTEQYDIEQFGYIAAIGPDSQNGVFRFNIYDAADLMKRQPATVTYDKPQAEQVANFVAYDEDFGLDENTIIPVRAVSTTAPGEAAEVDGQYETAANDVAGWINQNVPILKFQRGEDAALTPFREWVDDTLNLGGKKHFRRNRDTLTDVMNWLTSEIGGAWYFEPTDEGVVLMVNNGTESEESPRIARSAYYDGNFNPDGLEYIQGFNPVAVDVLNNSSLEDLKPINHLELNGESADSLLGVNTNRFDLKGPIGAPTGHTNKYPSVSVTYPPLLRRTGGTRLGPKTINSGKTTIDAAEQQAVKEFLKAHEDSTDGSLEVKSLPPIRPYDYVAAVPVANDVFDADMQPIQYEVNTVRHQTSGDTPYTTTLGVSMAIDEDLLTVNSTLKNLNK